MVRLRLVQSFLIGFVCLGLCLLIINKEELVSQSNSYAENNKPTEQTAHAKGNSSDVPVDDFKQLIDLRDFEFLKNHRKCNKLPIEPSVVIAIHTAPRNFNKRSVIRETWGFKDHRALLIFLIGTVDSKNLQSEIDAESEQYKDIVQGNFVDSYHNLTYKHMMAFKWFIYNCPDVPFLLKADDDLFINTPVLYDYLETPSDQSQFLHHRRVLLCTEVLKPKVKRTYRSKWRISFAEYREKYYPNYCEGCFTLYSSDVLTQLYHQAQQMPYFWIDDVYITGIVASKLNISITPTKGLILNNEEQLKLLTDQVNVESLQFFSIRPRLDATELEEKEFRKLWSLVSRTQRNLTRTSDRL